MSIYRSLSIFEIAKILSYHSPEVFASIKGKGIIGSFYVFPYHKGSLVVVEVSGLPDKIDDCANNIYAMHIHNGTSCSGDVIDPFKNADGHFSKVICPHPAHSGDLPSLFSFNNQAWLAVYTERFRPLDIVGRTIIIHEHAEDFKTQPSGNAGKMIACGEIMVLK
jgi:Cu/Zn superoxide dismutase